MNVREYICERCGEQPKLFLEEHGDIWLMCDCEDISARVTRAQVANAPHIGPVHSSPWQPKEEEVQPE